LSFILSGCIYSNVTMPLTSNFNNTKIGSKRIVLDERMVSEPITGLGISVMWSENLIRKEAQSAGIQDFSFAEQRVLSVLFGIYKHRELIIYGD